MSVLLAWLFVGRLDWSAGTSVTSDRYLNWTDGWAVCWSSTHWRSWLIIKVSGNHTSSQHLIGILSCWVRWNKVIISSTGDSAAGPEWEKCKVKFKFQYLLALPQHYHNFISDLSNQVSLTPSPPPPTSQHSLGLSWYDYWLVQFYLYLYNLTTSHTYIYWTQKWNEIITW